MSNVQPNKAINLYHYAKHAVLSAGFAWEIEWQKTRSLSHFSEPDLMREAAWVILCSGFREASIRRCFDYISLCFCDWESAGEIARHRALCVATALSAFGNKPKLNAIAQIADIIYTVGFAAIKREIQDDPINQLQKFPFIGPITSWHLAKNIGLNVAKNDRHLLRIANCYGYTDGQSLCDDLSALTGDPSSVVDIILWRFAVLSYRSSARALRDTACSSWNAGHE